MQFFGVLMAFTAVATAQGTNSLYAQTSSITSAPTSQFTAPTTATSTTSNPFTHTILAGKAGHLFSPNVTTAEVGDIIEFDFYPTNHSVIRAAYGYPCVPYEMVLGAGYHGFWSGWEPVDAVLNSPPKWSVRLNDTDPIFFYCGAPGSCISYGMIGVINPNASTSLDHQRELALESTFALVPGEDWPSEGSIPSGVVTTTTTAATSPRPTVTSTSATTTAAPTAATSTGGSGLGAGAIAGIAIGAAAVLLAAGMALWFCGRQSNRSTTPPTVAPAREVVTGYDATSQPPHAKHASMVSGYTMPPGYEPLRSPMSQAVHSSVDPFMEQHVMLNSGVPSPPI